VCRRKLRREDRPVFGPSCPGILSQPAASYCRLAIVPPHFLTVLVASQDMWMVPGGIRTCCFGIIRLLVFLALAPVVRMQTLIVTQRRIAEDRSSVRLISAVLGRGTCTHWPRPPPTSCRHGAGRSHAVPTPGRPGFNAQLPEPRRQAPGPTPSLRWLPALDP